MLYFFVNLSCYNSYGGYINISFRKLIESDNDFKLLYKWCQNKSVYEWFEQRKLSFEEIKNKYTKKIKEKQQELFIIQYNNIDIGLIQLYRFENDIDNIKINELKNIYEFDIYIGEEEFLSKGIGLIVVKKITEMIYSQYNADAIILRPFKRNIRALKCYIKNGYEIIDEYSGKDSLNNIETIVVLLNKRCL